MIKETTSQYIRSRVLLGIAALALVLAANLHAYADWRKEMGVFRIGIASVHGEPVKAERLEPFRLAIHQALNMPVEIFQARDGSALIDAVASSRVEYAVMPAIGYATLEESCRCTVPLVAPKSDEGAIGVRSVLVSNPQRISAIDEIAKSKIAVGPDHALTGSIIPKVTFKSRGNILSETGAELIETANQEQALELFINEQVDAFFAWEYIYGEGAAAGDNTFIERINGNSDLNPVILWTSEPFRFGPHIVRKNLPADSIEALKSTLLKLETEAPLAFDAISPDLAGGLVPVSADDYENIRQLVRTIGLKQSDN